ncbi:sulfur carrier protein [Microbacterium trichothecenolyticum]|uniref:sulfur carrier protein ThiS n=1 Tax=Microbacterium trichothecenolyticum TaxID=69370 RepID=UPI00285BF47E|nr:sulfur carrier protein ThiS [Microbacterium trichothecenolyticum]MDR7110702.1 sulfur carrier protein [Microbacterium trichothecenolyticum]
MTTITVNGEPHHSSTQPSVADLVEKILGVRIAPDGTLPDGTTLGIAVAVNSVVIPRADWGHNHLVDDDAVEIVSATKGG